MLALDDVNIELKVIVIEATVEAGVVNSKDT